MRKTLKNISICKRSSIKRRIIYNGTDPIIDHSEHQRKFKMYCMVGLSMRQIRRIGKNAKCENFDNEIYVTRNPKLKSHRRRGRRNRILVRSSRIRRNKYYGTKFKTINKYRIFYPSIRYLDLKHKSRSMDSLSSIIESFEESERRRDAKYS